MSNQSVTDDGITTDLKAVSITVGDLLVRFAESKAEVEAAQRLRYRVFYKEKGAVPNAESKALEMEIDEWDAVAYHLVVIDQKAAREEDRVIGTFRMTFNQNLQPGQQFYTQQFFNMDKLLARYDRILELGRACVDPLARSGSILRMLWKYAMKWVYDNNIDIIVGCASMPGTDIEPHKELFSHLHKYYLAPEEIRPKAIFPSHCSIDLLPDSEQHDTISVKVIPPLIRGYLKLGARVTDEAIIDHQFNTCFVGMYVIAKDMYARNHTLVTH